MTALATKLEAAAFAYHNGEPELMTDAEYDTALEELRATMPDHPFLKQVGAPVITGDEVPLPIPLPSLGQVLRVCAWVLPWEEQAPGAI